MSKIKNRKKNPVSKLTWNPWVLAARTRCRDMSKLTADLTQQSANTNYGVSMIQEAVKDIAEAVKDGDDVALRKAERRFDRQYIQFLLALDKVTNLHTTIRNYIF
jgi:histidinol dehydrogenase